MRSLIVALAVPALLAAVGVQPVGACSCVRPIGCYGDQAAALFVGRILDVKTEGDHQDARFEVERGAKGTPAGQVVVVRTAYDKTTCDLDFAAGQRWLIVADGPVPLSAGACSGSFQVRGGEAGPAFVDRGSVSGTLERWDPAGPGEPVHFDVGPGLRASPVLVASWTPEVCRTVTVQAQPAGKGP